MNDAAAFEVDRTAAGAGAAPSMQAAVLAEPGRFAVAQVARPRPGPGQVLLRLEGCGVCASSLPVWEGRPWFDYPLPPGAPGHEAWGRIEAVGAGVEGLRPGQRVAALSYAGHAEFDVADAAAVLPLPPSLEGLPFPGEPLACAANILERSDIRAGQTVAIVGIGFLGAVLTRLASQAGARVIALSRRAYARQMALRFGAEEALDVADLQAATAAVAELTGGRLCERVIEAAGLQSTLDLASALAAEGGRLVIAGYHQDGLRQVNLQQWNWRGLDVVNAHERQPARYIDGMRRAIAWVQEGRLDPREFFTHQLPMSRLDEALTLTRERPDGFLKALVVPEGIA
ncbi:MDR/zinc-dependent alcohol dehydrogenase-like family protein [Pseudacidovorax sp. NFM-22]|uniref:MDR/zinc-dependent alcohol dehydrogenase-like family protein n=1 Tax=Pseudacidovorax sp. NFM-22 TaxID=2744469 RepID=UPI001F38BFFC|nr:zinc-binding dehydrogenase [Pseudacidovorax sp. NFM-22]